MREEEVKALFLLAGMEALSVFKLENKYWPDAPEYAEHRRRDPWWLVKTPYGLIQIGWRKRVISIDWSDLQFRGVITKDDVTKDNEGVHAYSYLKALEYLTTLNEKASKEVLKH